MDDLSDDEEAILRFLRDQPRGQASHVPATHDNSYLSAQMREHTERIRDVLGGSRIAATSNPYLAGSQASARRMRIA